MDLEIEDPILIKLLEEETEEQRKLNQWTKDHLVSQTRLSKNFGHVNVYNRLNFKDGTLDKLESLRENFRSKAIYEIVDLLYIVGYSFKAMCYLLYRYGYEGSTTRQIRSYIADNKAKLDWKRKEFMSALIEAKREIFQTLQKEIREEEKLSIEMYVRKLQKLREEAENTDPIEDAPKFKRLINLMDDLQQRINECHGINAMRAAHVEVEKHKAIKEIDFEFDIKRLDFQYKNDPKVLSEAAKLGNGTNKIIEADSAFVGGDSPYDRHETLSPKQDQTETKKTLR